MRNFQSIVLPFQFSQHSKINEIIDADAFEDQNYAKIDDDIIIVNKDVKRALRALKRGKKYSIA